MKVFMRKLAKTLKALSDGSRLRILKMLEVRPLCVCEITEVLSLATSTVSRHLAILRDAGFILDKKEGKWVNYYLNHDKTNAYADQMLPLISEWLTDDDIVINDRKMVETVDRNKLCGI